MRFLALLPLLAALASGCATAHLTGEPPTWTADPGQARTVVLEPLFEVAEWQTSTRTEYAQVVSPGYLGGSGMGVGVGLGAGSYGTPSTVAINRQVTEKPLFARAPILADVYRRLLPAVQRLRPSWKVGSPSAGALAPGPVAVVRTVIRDSPTVASDRSLKNMAFGFGLLIWPLEIWAAQPVEETVRVEGTVERYDTTGPQLGPRLVRYASQPEAAVNVTGLPPTARPFGLEVGYEEGLLADETPRPRVLVEGFVDRLAIAIVALVEEGPATPAAIPPAP